MPEFLLELLSEEIPARMQEPAAAELLRAVVAGLGDLAPAATHSFATPRRIGIVLEGLPERRPDRVVETRGPRVGAPEAAVAGFLKSVGLGSVAECEIRDTGKASFYFAVRTEVGRPIAEELSALVPDVLDRMVWPKSMRWGSFGVRWVRPLHGILAVLSGGRRGEAVPIRWRLDRGKGEPSWLEADDTTFGHRFLAPDRFKVSGYKDYRGKLAERFVLIDTADRKARILDHASKLTAEQGLRLKDDPDLLDEVAGLIEWPVVRLGRIEPRFMALPPELLTTAMRTHQKYFACESAATSGSAQAGEASLAPFFVVVANNDTRDGGRQLVLGNERVLRARLSDAEFFWDLDRQTRLEARVPRLAERVFHAKLGSVHEKVERMRFLVPPIASFVPGADIDQADRAVLLAKADLSSALVGEFPELQGIMGRYLALHDGEAPAVADAIARHYAPAGLTDPTPTAPLAIVAALADKVDTLAGFFSIGETPTGSRDPYGLRRAALGVIRIVLENGLRLPLAEVFTEALRLVPSTGSGDGEERQAAGDTLDALLAFIADRLKVALRDEGVRHDLIAAVFALGGEDDLVRLVARTRALQALLGTEDGANLLTAYRRASKIVAIEEKRDGRSYRDPPDPALFAQGEEVTLAERLDEIGGSSRAALQHEDFVGAMAALAQLRRPVDDFFDRVTVNVENGALRANRLRLLARIWQALDRVADFSKIEG